VQSVCLSGETAAQEWLKNMMVQGASAEAMRPWILAPLSVPPRGSFNRGAVVCNCFDVSAAEIREALAVGADFARLQAQLKCGTECGSCMPELRRICAQNGVGGEVLAARAVAAPATEEVIPASRLTPHA
jgi:assimilatory nitrate reductase catalytic subunit